MALQQTSQSIAPEFLKDIGTVMVELLTKKYEPLTFSCSECNINGLTISINDASENAEIRMTLQNQRCTATYHASPSAPPSLTTRFAYYKSDIATSIATSTIDVMSGLLQIKKEKAFLALCKK